ncbi:UNVERIFIED_CONTAM: hypothetical protein Sradi_5625400 [Sesamum radiatum]|uniref:Reverse transcriptase zinc-binding domain-containing protein n=1 Tax=Sesamum radiatum TaxID=300843 RepID=A0AAW2L206_SESRA
MYEIKFGELIYKCSPKPKPCRPHGLDRAWARPCLAAGIRWKTGDGQCIQIMGHPWLPRPWTFRPVRRPNSLSIGAKVSELLTEEHAWNVELIRKEFCDMDAKCILEIALPSRDTRDELIWHYDIKGKFSVRSAYRVAAELRQEGGCSWQEWNWNFIWNSKVVPKVAMFVWRCTRDALPTTNNLKRRGAAVEEGCGRCDEKKEDTLHVLNHCTFARLVWALSGIQWSSIARPGKNVEEWFRGVHKELGGIDWVFFLTLCWAIWGSRNQYLFEGRNMEAQEVVWCARRMCEAIGAVTIQFVV